MARFGSAFGFASISPTGLKCRWAKTATLKVHRYEMDLLDQLIQTPHLLGENTGRLSSGCPFAVRHFPPRRILAADFDRLAHHFIVPWVECLFAPVSTHDGFSSRCSISKHAAVVRLQQLLCADPKEPANSSKPIE